MIYFKHRFNNNRPSLVSDVAKSQSSQLCNSIVRVITLHLHGIVVTSAEL